MHSASTMGRGNPAARLYSDTRMVFTSTRWNWYEPKNLVKFAMPTQRLPQMPSRILYLRKAICMPTMGA